MDVSLIVPTLGHRPGELRRLLESLAAQTVPPREVILVAQPDSEALGGTSHPDVPFSLRVVSSPRGASRARNAGVEIATGQILGFPDDDCWYPPDVIGNVVRYFRAHEDVAIVAGKSIEPSGRSSRLQWPNTKRVLSKRNLWVAVEYTYFCRSKVCATVGMFDENLGVGAPSPFQAGEATDHILRALACGFRGVYNPDVRIGHPKPAMARNAGAQKYFNYGMGVGLVMRRHGYSLPVLGQWLARPLVGALIAYVRGDKDIADWRLKSIRGRVEGWRAGSPSRADMRT